MRLEDDGMKTKWCSVVMVWALWCVESNFFSFVMTCFEFVCLIVHLMNYKLVLVFKNGIR